ncbi:MAG TPA: hypothetical protein VMI09_00520 [Candidatus Binataceae bacterium]|nr:hypothetical protein [Candidatus Binataceae bacterium]
MRQIVELQTRTGSKFSIALDNWGSGLDVLMRRWILLDGHWKCADSQDWAEESGRSGVQILNTSLLGAK